MGIKQINEGHLTRISLAASRMLSIYGDILLPDTVVELRAAVLGFDSRVDLRDKVCKSIEGYRTSSGLYDIDSPDYKVYSQLIILFDKWREDVDAYYRIPAEVSKSSVCIVNDMFSVRISGFIVSSEEDLFSFTKDFLNSWSLVVNPASASLDSISQYQRAINSLMEVMDDQSYDYDCISKIWDILEEWINVLLQMEKSTTSSVLSSLETK